MIFLVIKMTDLSTENDYEVTLSKHKIILIGRYF